MDKQNIIKIKLQNGKWLSIAQGPYAGCDIDRGTVEVLIQDTPSDFSGAAKYNVNHIELMSILIKELRKDD